MKTRKVPAKELDPAKGLRAEDYIERKTQEVVIPSITGSDSLVLVLDELKHQLKQGVVRNDLMCQDFNEVLNDFLKRWGLDRDQHSFATMPERIAMKCSRCGEYESMTRVHEPEEGVRYRCACGETNHLLGDLSQFEDT